MTFRPPQGTYEVLSVKNSSQHSAALLASRAAPCCVPRLFLADPGLAKSDMPTGKECGGGEGSTGLGCWFPNLPLLKIDFFFQVITVEVWDPMDTVEE